MTTGLVAVALIATACGSDDSTSTDSSTDTELDTAATGSDTPASTAEQASGDIPTIRIGWGLAGDELKYPRIADPSLAPNEGTCYETEYIQFPGSSAATQALAAGELDTTITASLTAANAAEQGADILITQGILNETKGNYTTTWMVAADGEVSSPADVEGKTVGTSGIGNSTNYLQQFYFEDQAGLTEGSDYTVVEVPYPGEQEALSAGQLDVGVFAQPFYGGAAASGEFEELFSVSDLFDDFVQLIEVFDGGFADEHPEAVACWIEDQQTMHDWINDPANRDRFIELTAQTTTIPAEVLGYLLTEDDYARPENNVLDQEGLQSAWDFFAGRGGISSDLKVADFVDPELSAQ